MVLLPSNSDAVWRLREKHSLSFHAARRLVSDASWLLRLYAAGKLAEADSLRSKAFRGKSGRRRLLWALVAMQECNHSAFEVFEDEVC